MDRKLGGLMLCAALAGCTTTQVHRNPGMAYAQTNASAVAILYSAPKKDYESLGVVSAKRYKPGWTDPSVADAIPQLQSAAADLGADAIIVLQSGTFQSRNVTVEGEAIRYTDKPAQPSAATQQPCAACASIGEH